MSHSRPTMCVTFCAWHGILMRRHPHRHYSSTVLASRNGDFFFENSSSSNAFNKLPSPSLKSRTNSDSWDVCSQRDQTRWRPSIVMIIQNYIHTRPTICVTFCTSHGIINKAASLCGGIWGRLSTCIYILYIYTVYILAWENSRFFTLAPLAEETSEQRAKKFHTDDVNLPRSG